MSFRHTLIDKTKLLFKSKEIMNSPPRKTITLIKDRYQDFFTQEIPLEDRQTIVKKDLTEDFGKDIEL